MNLDEISALLGEFGPYQKCKYFLICLFATLSALHAINMVFVGAEPKYHCNLPDINDSFQQNATYNEKLNLFIPAGEKCRQYNVTERAYQLYQLNYNISAVLVLHENVSQIACTAGYNYSKEQYITTITSDFNLVCENKQLRSTSRSVFFAGRLVGAVTFGQLSDRFGRRPMFLTGILLLLIAGIVASMAPNMYVFLPMYFLQGAAHTGAFLVAYTMCTELVGPKYRAMAGFVIQIFYGFGYVLLAGLGYFIREWRYLELAITLPAVLFGTYWWLLPESIPWLLSRGRDSEAEAILLKAAKKNGVTLPPDIIRSVREDPRLKGEKKQYFFMDCLRTRNMALLSLNVWFNWLVNSFAFYGISLNSENLSGNPYLNFCLTGTVGMIAYAACLPLVAKTGRRLGLILCMCIGGVACIVAGLLIARSHPVYAILVKVFALLGNFCITASYSIIYLMAAELFPTVVRTIGMGVSSMSARIGGICAPFVLDLKETWSSLPLLVFGSLAIIAGLLALFLPETANRPLPQTLEDVKDRGHGLQCLKSSKKLEVNRPV